MVVPVLLPFLSFAVTYPALAVAAPLLHAMVRGGVQATAEVVVVSRERPRLFCANTLIIRAGPTAPEHRLCGLNEAVWAATGPGQPLRVTGLVTPYGIRYFKAGD